jgi:FdhE protein
VESRLRARIAALADAMPALADDPALRGALIEILDRAETAPFELRMPGDLARARLAAGVPLLDRVDVPIPPSTAAVLEQLAIATLADPAARHPVERLLAAMRAHRAHPEQLVAEGLAGHDDHLGQLAEAVDAPAPLVLVLADLAARPLLAALAGRLRPALGLGRWERGYCPICGARPTLAERAHPPEPADPRDGDVRMRCGRCTTGWAWSLPRCPDCQDGRLTMLDTLDLPDGRRSLTGCDACRSYLKVADAPRAERLTGLLLDDVASWPLDRLALARGLARPDGPGHRLEHGDGFAEELDDD